jgi:hypothetical protein
MSDETSASSSTVTFGTVAYAGSVTGLIITSIKIGSTAQSAEAMDESGNIIQVDMYGKKKTVQVEGTVQGGTISLVAGGTLSVGNDTYTIESVEVSATNTGHTTASITGSAPMDASDTPSGTPGGSGD